MLTGFETTVEHHQKRIFSFAYYLLASREEAEDVTQEVLLRLFRHRRRLDPERLGAWLLKVTRNACWDLLRQRRSRGAELPLEDDTVELPDDGAATPQQRAETAAFRRRLREELAGLPEPYKSVVILREIQGLRYQEIAEALEMPLNTVRVNLHRGRRKLRERLREEYPDATIH